MTEFNLDDCIAVRLEEHLEDIVRNAFTEGLPINVIRKITVSNRRSFFIFLILHSSLLSALCYLNLYVYPTETLLRLFSKFVRRV